MVVFPITLPPLRQRAGDIPVLIEHFAAQVCAQNGWKPVPFTADAIQKLTSYSWPGNVRELRNMVERLLLLATGVAVDSATVDLALPRPGARRSYQARAPTWAAFRHKLPAWSERPSWRNCSASIITSPTQPRPWAWSAAISTRNASSWGLTCARCAMRTETHEARQPRADLPERSVNFNVSEAQAGKHAGDRLPGILVGNLQDAILQGGISQLALRFLTDLAFEIWIGRGEQTSLA